MRAWKKRFSRRLFVFTIVSSLSAPRPVDNLSVGTTVSMRFYLLKFSLIASCSQWVESADFKKCESSRELSIPHFNYQLAASRPFKRCHVYSMSSWQLVSFHTEKEEGRMEERWFIIASSSPSPVFFFVSNIAPISNLPSSPSPFYPFVQCLDNILSRTARGALNSPKKAPRPNSITFKVFVPFCRFGNWAPAFEPVFWTLQEWWTTSASETERKDVTVFERIIEAVRTACLFFFVLNNFRVHWEQAPFWNCSETRHPRDSIWFLRILKTRSSVFCRKIHNVELSAKISTLTLFEFPVLFSARKTQRSQVSVAGTSSNPSSSILQFDRFLGTVVPPCPQDSQLSTRTHFPFDPNLKNLWSVKRKERKEEVFSCRVPSKKGEKRGTKWACL